MNLNEFMEKNNIVIVAKANLQEKSFEIIKNDLKRDALFVDQGKIRLLRCSMIAL